MAACATGRHDRIITVAATMRRRQAAQRHLARLNARACAWSAPPAWPLPRLAPTTRPSATFRWDDAASPPAWPPAEHRGQAGVGDDGQDGARSMTSSVMSLVSAMSRCAATSDWVSTRRTRRSGRSARQHQAQADEHASYAPGFCRPGAPRTAPRRQNAQRREPGHTSENTTSHQPLSPHRRRASPSAPRSG